MDNIKAIFFDLDGTLLNSTHVWTMVDEVFLEKRGKKVTREYLDALGHLTIIESAEHTKKLYDLDEHTDDIIAEWKELANDEYAHKIELKSGALKYLDYVKSKDIRLAVTTGLTIDLMTVALTRLGIIDYFDILVSTEHVGVGKGSPKIYHYAMEKLNVQASDCLAFDDLLPVIKSIAIAGVKSCGVFDKASEHLWEDIKTTADYHIKDWHEAISVLHAE